MSGNPALAKNTTIEPCAPTGAAAPTGYRVSLVPGALEVSARLASSDELRSLVRVSRASIVILDDVATGDADQPLTLSQRVAEAAPRGK